MPNLSIFGLKLENKIVIFEINILEFFLITKFCEVIKMSTFGTKNPYLDTFGLEFENDIVIFEIRTLQFDYKQFQNVMRIFDVLPNFAFPTSETMNNYYL